MKQDMSKTPVLSVVMPAYNEAESLPATIERTTAALSQLGALAYEIILVDDGSDDNTWGVIGELSGQWPALRGLRFSRNFGHQAALLAGIRSARGQAVITLDSDGQHPPELIPKMLEKWRGGAAVVQGLRVDEKGTGALKRSSSGWFYRLYSWLTDTRIPPGSADFRLLDRSVVEVIRAHPRSALFLRGFVPWIGLPTEYIEFVPDARTAGTTKYSPGRMFGLARQGIMSFSIKPLRLASLTGGVTCMLALAYLVYTIAIRLFGAPTDYVPGWASVAGLLSLLGGLQLLIMGILGEYIGMIFMAEQDRPAFVVADETDSAPPTATNHPPPPGEE
jgi:glycosyltransferase involved in cell wall biosynthesis